MTISELMSRDVRTCAPTDSLQSAAQIMWERDCGSVPVLECDGRVVGIVTDRDLCMAAMLRGQPLHACGVREVMSAPVLTCREDQSVQDAEEVMRTNRIRRLPILRADGQLAGILSLNDLALAAPNPGNQRHGLRPEGVTTTLAAISRHRTHNAQAA